MGEQGLDKAAREEILRRYLTEHGLKSTRQRDLIAEAFFDAETHVRIDEILERVRTLDPKVSQATVYRTMKLLKDSGLAVERRFSDGQTLYESSDQGEQHHDHLICTRCGKIVEFVDERIERLQKQVAEEHGFAVEDHKMELYGLCRDCQLKG